MSNLQVGSGEGSPTAKVMLVGEAWTYHDAQVRQPFQGSPGQELNRLLQSAGILRSECYATNVVNSLPPGGDIERWLPTKRKDQTPDMRLLRDRFASPALHAGFAQLLREIHLLQPNVIIAFGNLAMWALTGAWGITKWRGSQLTSRLDRNLYPPGMLGPMEAPWQGKVIPTLHPAALFRDGSQRPTVVNDLKRAARERHSKEYSNVPQWNFIVRPSFEVAHGTLERLIEKLTAEEITWIDFDLETQAGHISCAGISWSNLNAISIPFMCREAKEGYWMLEEEAFLVWLLWRLLTHPKVKVRGQNLLYDAQYTYRHWHFVPRVVQDTMIAHHSVFCGLPKSLDFLASLYCDYYVQWKPEKSAWKVGG